MAGYISEKKQRHHFEMSKRRKTKRTTSKKYTTREVKKRVLDGATCQFPTHPSMTCMANQGHIQQPNPTTLKYEISHPNIPPMCIIVSATTH